MYLKNFFGEDEIVERLAKKIYKTHWRSPNPVWENASENVKDWVRQQALDVLDELQRLEEEMLEDSKV